MVLCVIALIWIFILICFIDNSVIVFLVYNIIIVIIVVIIIIIIF